MVVANILVVPVVIVVVVVVVVGGGRHGLAAPIADGGSGQGASCCGCWRWVFLQHLLPFLLAFGLLLESCST